MEEALQQITNNITTLKWLLMFVTLMLLTLIAIIIYFFKNLMQAVKNSESRVEANVFQDKAAALLDDGKDAELRKLAEERLLDWSSDSWAHYYLGMALYRLRDPFLAKQHFMKAGELDPRLKSVTDECLEEVNRMISEHKPHLV